VYSIKTAPCIIPRFLVSIFRAIKRGLFYLLFNLITATNITKPIQYFLKSNFLSYRVFPHGLIVICLFISGCLDSEKHQHSSPVDPETVQNAVHSVVGRANYELARPHSILITPNHWKEFKKGDYVSLATYWWPNADTGNGLPYIRKDGRVNPQTMTDQSNLPQLIRMARRIEVFSAAYRFTGNDIYAKRAVEQLQIWFCDPKTAMLPHLEHAQLIRGVNSGRSYGVIDGWWLVRVADSIPLLKSSSAWSSETDRFLKAWFTHYMNWLINSSFGIQEKNQKNNRGTCYDVQVVTYAQYLGWDRFTIQYPDRISRERISEQILFSGKQRFEASRTRPEHYSIYNLYGLLILARIARENGIDITEQDYLFSGNLRKAYQALTHQVGRQNPASFTKKFDETDTARIWYLLLIEAHLLFDEPATLKNLERFAARFPELHSRYMSAYPEIVFKMINQAEIS